MRKIEGARKEYAVAEAKTKRQGDKKLDRKTKIERESEIETKKQREGEIERVKERERK